MIQSAYKFKWKNHNIDDYLKNRRFVASSKRREADLLIKQAETIEMEMSELQIALEPVPEEED